MRDRRSPRALALAALLLAPALLVAGCFGPEESGGDWTADSPDPAAAPGATSDKGWRAGKWWAYKATFEGDLVVDVALVVFEQEDDHFTLGTNLTAGFFGLPFHGNVTRPDLNPVIARDEWPLYRFPLEDGKSWQYEMFDYTLTTRVKAVDLNATEAGEHPGFRMTSSAFGRTVVEYTYSPEVEWFTELVIYEPTDGHEVVRVELTDYGPDYEDDYYVNVPVHAYDVEYPGAPGSDAFTVTGEYMRLTATVLLHGRVGSFEFELEDPHGRTVMDGNVRPYGLLMDREDLPVREGTWRVSDVGVGDGRFVFEVTGLQATRDGARVPFTDVNPPPDASRVPVVNLPALLESARASSGAEPANGATPGAGGPVGTLMG